MVGAISEFEERTDEIATASEKQSTTSEQIAHSAQSMSTAAHESSTAVTQAFDPAQNLDALTDKLQDSIRRFRGVSSREKGMTGPEAAVSPKKAATFASVNQLDPNDRAKPVFRPKRNRGIQREKTLAPISMVVPLATSTLATVAYWHYAL